MKNLSKLTKKLLLSALTLGLAVVTLTTTTFAWYTTSTEVNVTNGQGTASGSTSATTLLISSDNTNWGKEVKLSSASNLVPVEWNPTSGKFEELNSDAEATGIYKFKLYLKTTKTWESGAQSIPVYLKSFTLKNTTGATKSETNILGADNDTVGAPKTALYSVNIVRALNMLVVDNASTPNYNFYDLSNIDDVTGYEESGFTNIETDANALAYYNKVMGASLTKPATEAAYSQGGTGLYKALALKDIMGTIVSDASAGSYQTLELEFTVYINGWSNYCFDACKGQSFSLALDFTTNNA